MATPEEILLFKFGDVSLQKSKNLRIVSQENSEKEIVCSSYEALVRVGNALPSYLVAWADISVNAPSIKLKDLKFTALHVRSYHSASEMKQLGVNFDALDEQEVNSASIANFPNHKVHAVSQTKTSKTYKFDEPAYGKVTIFTDKPKVEWAGNNLPAETRLLPWINEYNFVYQK